MRHLSVAEMREADRRAIEVLGIPGAVLMNYAGAAVYRELPPGPVTVICGKGNNGGDGYVVARLALLDERPIRVILLADLDDITGDALTFLNVYRRLGGEVETATSEFAATEAFNRIPNDGVIVDALLGTGIKGELRGLPRHAIENWPQQPPTVAVDIPSGMNADSGESTGACVRATKTVTLQHPKTGFQNPEAAPYLGQLIVADIGIPAICADDTAWKKLNLD